MDDDTIQQFLASTGLSCDDLLKKLLQLKKSSNSPNASEGSAGSSSQNDTINHSQETNKTANETNNVHLELNINDSTHNSPQPNVNKLSKTKCDSNNSDLVDNGDDCTEASSVGGNVVETQTGKENVKEKTEFSTLVCLNDDTTLPKHEATSIKNENICDSTITDDKIDLSNNNLGLNSDEVINDDSQCNKHDDTKISTLNKDLDSSDIGSIVEIDKVNKISCENSNNENSSNIKSEFSTNICDNLVTSSNLEADPDKNDDSEDKKTAIQESKNPETGLEKVQKAVVESNPIIEISDSSDEDPNDKHGAEKIKMMKQYELTKFYECDDVFIEEFEVMDLDFDSDKDILSDKDVSKGCNEAKQTDKIKERNEKNDKTVVTQVDSEGMKTEVATKKKNEAPQATEDVSKKMNEIVIDAEVNTKMVETGEEFKQEDTEIIEKHDNVVISADKDSKKGDNESLQAAEDNQMLHTDVVVTKEDDKVLQSEEEFTQKKGVKVIEKPEDVTKVDNEIDKTDKAIIKNDSELDKESKKGDNEAIHAAEYVTKDEEDEVLQEDTEIIEKVKEVTKGHETDKDLEKDNNKEILSDEDGKKDNNETLHVAEKVTNKEDNQNLNNEVTTKEGDQVLQTEQDTEIIEKVENATKGDEEINKTYKKPIKDDNEEKDNNETVEDIIKDLDELLRTDKTIAEKDVEIVTAEVISEATQIGKVTPGIEDADNNEESNTRLLTTVNEISNESTENNSGSDSTLTEEKPIKDLPPSNNNLEGATNGDCDNTNNSSLEKEDSSPFNNNTTMNNSEILNTSIINNYFSSIRQHNITNGDFQTSNKSTYANPLISNSPSDKEESLEDSSHSKLKDDEIRNSLKLQLSSLRNRKVNREVSSATKTLQLAHNTTERNRKKKLIKEDGLNSPVLEIGVDLVSMSEETNFIISSVEGAVDIEENTEKGVSEKEESIVLTKTTDIKKIKGWKKKQFVLQNPLIVDKTKPISDVFEQPHNSKVELNIFKNFGSSVKHNNSEETSSNCLASTSSSSLPYSDLEDNANDGLKSDTMVSNPLEELRKIISKGKDQEKKRFSFESDNSNSVGESKLNSKSQSFKEECDNVRKENTGKSDKSPFVSDTLENFLNANATLNVSYQLPKLHAEEGIVSNYPKEIPSTLFNSGSVLKKTREKTTPIKNEVPEIKAKTLAEKRRLLEKLKRKNIKKAENKIKKDLARIKIKVCSEIFENVQEKQTVEQPKLIHKSYILYNNKKVNVPSYLNGICLTKVNDSNTASVSPSVKRLSLLKELEKKSLKAVKYLPGPLSKKANQEITYLNEKWSTCVKKLPEIHLQVIPEVGKPLHPKVLQRMPSFDWNINQVQLEFALSAVFKAGAENKPTHSFKWKIPYVNNEKHIIARKKIREALSPPTTPVNKSVEDEVKGIVEGLLNYVELKELGDTYIKEEPHENVSSTTVSPISENNSLVLKKPKKRTKVDMELSRLSCKVVNVASQNSCDEKCNKPFCTLGCVCQSLKCETIYHFHCRKIDCMFNCSCPKLKTLDEREYKLPCETDLLSKDTVSEIENHAKRNLAKVEREFTQTIIHTNDKTIVIGAGGNKSRRATKFPKKYSDYVEITDDFQPGLIKETNKIDGKFYQKCVVNLPKLKLTDVIPYCLVHKKHNCLCRGHDGFPVETEQKIKKETPITPNEVETVTPEQHDEDIIIVDDYVKPCPASKKLLHKNIQNCARTRMVFANYLIRNSTEVYKKALLRKLKVVRYRNYSGEVNLHGANETSNTVINVDQFMIPSASNVRQRKQSFQVRVDEPSHSKKIQRRKSKKGTIPSAVSVNPDLPRKLFKTEIILPVHKNGEFLKALQVNTVPKDNIRILNWNDLLEGYKSKEITILHKNSDASNILITPSSRSTPSEYVPLSHKSSNIDLVKWILNKENPMKKTQLFSVLFPESKHFILVGFCLKSFDPLVNSMIVLTVNKNNATSYKLKLKLLEAQEVIVSKSESKRCRSVLNPNRKIAPPAEKIVTESERYTHKNLKGGFHVTALVIYKCDLMDKTLGEVFTEESDTLTKEKLAVPLPNNLTGKWMMIYLRSDFFWLTFSKNKYSIKYTDLMSVVKKSNLLKCTIAICNREMSHNATTIPFGIYVVPTFQDRIFIGPYDIFENHDLQTLRYMKKALIDTNLFNKICGLPNDQIGKWFCQSSSPTCTIDLTSEECSKDSNSSSPRNDDSTSTTKSLLKRKNSESSESEPSTKLQRFEEVVTVVDGNYKLHKFNRYIFSNIPYLGYLKAYQKDDDEHLLVVWPINNKILEFENTQTALIFLTQRLSIYLQRIPEEFQIKLVVLKNLIGPSVPIHSSCLNGYHICGEFGVYDLKTITSEILSKIGVSMNQILDGLYKRTQSICRLQMHELGKVLNGDDETNALDPELIMDKAIEEITNLKSASEELTSVQTFLEHRKLQQTSEILNLLKQFPQSLRLKELKKLTSYTNYSSKSKRQSDAQDEMDSQQFNKSLIPDDIECIEILDSDEDSEKNVLETNAQSPPPLERQSPTPPIINLNFQCNSPPNLQAEEEVDPLETTIKPNKLPNLEDKAHPTILKVIKPPLATSKTLKMQSVLKSSKMPKTYSMLNSMKPAKVLSGMKIIKTSSGQYVLVKSSSKTENTDTNTSTSPSKSGTRYLIQSNNILSVSSISDANDKPKHSREVQSSISSS